MWDRRKVGGRNHRPRTPRLALVLRCVRWAQVTSTQGPTLGHLGKGGLRWPQVVSGGLRWFQVKADAKMQVLLHQIVPMTAATAEMHLTSGHLQNA